MTDYLRTRAPSRLIYWKAQAAKAGNPEFRTWQKNAGLMLGHKLKPDGFSTGYNGEGRNRVPVYVSFSEQLPEQDAGDVIRLDHNGWYCDTMQNDLAIGIVAKLPHGRYLAGYRLTMNGERVYFHSLHDSKEDAARMADEHARIIGEAERENAEQFDAAQELQQATDEAAQELGKAFALRNHPYWRETSREAIPDLIETIRANRARLSSEFSDYL